MCDKKNVMKICFRVCICLTSLFLLTKSYFASKEFDQKLTRNTEFQKSVTTALTLHTKEKYNESFWVLNSALENHFDPDHKDVLGYREILVKYPINTEDQDLLMAVAKNADFVIKESNDLFALGCAWYHKGSTCIRKKQFNECMKYIEISLHYLSQYEEAKTANAPLLAVRLFKGLNHKNKELIYNFLEDKEKAMEEQKVVETLKGAGPAILRFYE